MRHPSLVLSGIALSCLLLLPACRGNVDQAAPSTETDAALPKPAAGNGSVTGMPDRPGPGPIGHAVQAQDAVQDSPFASDGTGIDGTGIDSAGMSTGTDAGFPGSQATSDDGPVADVVETVANDARIVLSDYYAAINTRQYDRAYRLWSDDGKASGQTLQQFAHGFADTTNVEASLGEPGRVDAAAGSRYNQVPLSIATTHDNGQVRRYIGNYTLRRAVVDGATPEQRAWRIASADIRVVDP